MQDKTYLGTLCKHGHDYKNTGMSERYKKSPHSCIECKRIQSANWTKANPERRRELQSTWNASHKSHHADWKRANRKRNPFGAKLISTRDRAAKRGLPFNLTKEYIEELWHNQNGLCYWLNCPMQHNLPSRHPLKATIDRLVLDDGYVVGNVVWSSSFANIGRNIMEAEEFRSLLPQLGFHK